MELSFVKQNVCNDAVSKHLNEPPTADKIKRTDATCLEKLVQRNHNLMFDQPAR